MPRNDNKGAIAMRESGILMHITSLPGRYGIGTMGKSAYSFVDFLKKAGQSYWQILPLNPTSYGDSPYQSCSTFAGNHYLIDLDTLVEEGLLKEEELAPIVWCSWENKVDYGKQYDNRLKVLRLAYDRFESNEEFVSFCRDNGSWLADFALFMALKAANGGKPWYEWETSLKVREPNAIWQARRELRGEVSFYSFVQYLFYKQWTALRAYAHENGIRIIGDVPIYVPYDSADVWANPHLFQMDEELTPTRVAGCPPDAFSDDGQLWGNPLYRWELMAEDGYAWWMSRLAAAGKLYDVIRLDHFRGFEAYWSVPYGDKTARGGKWIKGPDKDFVNAIKKNLPDLDLIAEDLGVLTDEVLELRDGSGFPGMKVLQFAFDSREPSEYLPLAYTPNTVCYPGTHDNMTTRQWLESLPEDAADYAKEYMALTKEEGFVWGVIRTAMSSVSNLCVTAMQDFLNIGKEGRMNFPGTMTDANWTWRAGEDMITDTLAEKINRMTRLYNRAAK